jgi:SAM-dependent methyltransferase
MDNKDKACRICGNGSGNKIYTAREMMFGMRDAFEYMECGSCGCVQLVDIPPDLNVYYPKRYYSFERPEAFAKFSRDNFFVRFLRRRRSIYLFEGRSLIGRMLSIINPAQPKLMRYADFFRKCHARLSSKILDVGCGNGKMLSELAWYGFTALTGADLFIDADFHAGNVTIHKSDIFSLEGGFDLIMFNHSFEHMSDPLAVLSRSRRLLSDTGMVMIRIPTVSSYAWEHYGVNWVGLDAPRHLFLYSLEAIQILAGKAGFSIQDVLYDSTEFQIWGSEQYLSDIPLKDKRSYDTNPRESIFTDTQIKSFAKRAEELNKEKRGDTICIFLAKEERERK